MSTSPLVRAHLEQLQRFGERDVALYDGTWFSSGALHERAQRWAAGLRDRGVQPGDRVVVLLANSPEVGVAYEAIWSAGGVAVPVLFLASGPDLAHVLASSGAVAAISSTGLLSTLMSVADGTSLTTVVSVDGLPGQADPRLVDEQHLGGPQLMTAQADGSTLAALLFTGGTTGRSKAVQLTHGNLISAGQAAVQAGWVEGMTSGLSVLPLAHVYGLVMSVAGLLAPEPTWSVQLPWFVAADALDMLEKHRLQSTALVPSMISMLLAEGLEGRDLSALRHVTSGGAPLSAAVADAFVSALPHVELLEGYGATETAAICTISRPGRGRLGFVGTAAPGYSVRTVLEDGTDAMVGQPGEIVVRGPGVTTGYWQDPEATAELLRDGWLHTGDVGVLDADGYLQIVDRLKDLILRGGFNVYPRDVEDVLHQHEDVTGAAVVGRPDTVLGEEVVAYVTLRPGSTLTAQELVAWSRARISAAKYPREVHVVEVLPLTSVGKLDRKALRASAG